MSALAAAAPLPAAAQSTQAETVLASYPAGGQGLATAVAEVLSSDPEQAAAFCSAAGAAPLAVQSAIGAGMAHSVRLLQASDGATSANLVHSAACSASGCPGATLASYAVSLGGVSSDLCRLVLSDQGLWVEDEEETESLKTPPPTLFRTSATQHGANALAVVSPN